MKTLKKIILGTAVFAGLVGGTYFNYHGIVRERKNLIYQGYHINKADGYNLLIFDDVPATNRNGEPDLKAIGNPNEFRIGTKYNIEYRTPRWFGLNRIISEEPSN